MLLQLAAHWGVLGTILITHKSQPTNAQERKWFPKTVGGQPIHHEVLGPKGLHLLVMTYRI